MTYGYFCPMELTCCDRDHVPLSLLPTAVWLPVNCNGTVRI